MPTQTQKSSAKTWGHEYETTYILRPDVKPEQAEKVSSRVSDIMDRLGGKLVQVDNWGRRRLAYTIDKHTRGIFVHTRYVGYNNLVPEVERNLRMLDEVMRFLTVKLRDMVDVDEVQVDPEEVKFLRVEPVEEEEEVGLEERLGLSEKKSSSRSSSGSDEEE